MHQQPEMTKWERVRATLAGEETDRAPVALWRHFPPEDEIPEKLAKATLGFQNKYDWDLVKLTPTGTYSAIDWGAETAWQPNEMGVRTVTRFGVPSPDAWGSLEKIDVTKGYIANQNKALYILAKELKGEAPILQTVFSPLTTARKLAGDRIFEDLRNHPEVLKYGLEIITEATLQFALEALKAGADGFFFATQLASRRLLTEREYQEFGEAYDLRILKAIRLKAEIIVLHIHGEDIHFDLANRYPVDAVNWHDQITSPTLETARTCTQIALVGGINEWNTLQHGPVSAIQEEVQRSIRVAGHKKLILAPGCVIPRNTPEEHIWAVRNAVQIHHIVE